MAKTFVSAVMVVLCVSLIAASAVEAQGLLGGILGSGSGLLSITGKIFCTLNGGMGVNGTATPAFPNALVQMRCGSGNNVVSSVRTDANGAFSMLLDPVQFVLSSILQNCNLAVTTPLSTCDASLPSVGGLISALQNIGSLLLGLLNVQRLIPTGFNFLPSLI